MRRPARSPGFALLEILVAVAILAVLATGSMWMILRLDTKLNAKTENDMMKSLGEAIIRYYNDNGSFPTALSNLLSTNGAGMGTANGWQGPYIAETDAALTRDSWWNDTLGATREWVCSGTPPSADNCAIVAFGPNHTRDSDVTTFPVIAAGDDIVRNINRVAAVQVGDRGIARAMNELRQLDDAANRHKLDDPTFPTTPNAVNELIGTGRVAGGLRNDPWGNRYRWDNTAGRFFSRGPSAAGLADSAGCNDGNDVTATAVGQNMGGANCTNAR